MNLFLPSEIKNLLLKYHAKPSKGLGQNFLINKGVLEKIIDASDIKKTDIILEVGPGIGTLTEALAQKAKEVIAVEKDTTMVNMLEEVLRDSNIKNVEVINDDILKLDNLKLIKNLKLKIKNYKVVSNIPYYITAPLIRFLLENESAPKEIILMVQKEVAQRICAKPPEMSILSVSVQFYAEAKILFYVSRGSFWPIPNVDSAVIKITPKKKHKVSEELFFKVVKAGFSQPRKQIAGNLTKVLKLEKEQIEKWLWDNKIDPTRRAETLSIEDWQNLTKTLPAKSVRTDTFGGKLKI